MNRAYLDTNALISLSKGSRVLEAINKTLPGYTIVVLQGVVRELHRLAQGSSQQARAAKLAADVVKKQHLKTEEHSIAYVDTALVEVATPSDAIITSDKELQKRAKTAGIPVFTIARTQIQQV